MRLSDILRSRGRTEADQSVPNPETAWREEVQSVPLAEIRQNPYQPRIDFDEEQLQELAASIREHGILHPVVVRPREDGFELVVGERRLRACTILGWESIPAIVREMSDSEVAEVALIENVQREGLSFFEEAEGYRRLIEEFGMTQEVLAQRLGKSQSAIANKIRLLKLPEEVRRRISREMLSERHARALLKLPSEEVQLEAIEVIVHQGYNVRQTDEWVANKLQHIAGAEEKETKKRSVKGVLKDYRLLVNSIRKLVDQMNQGGIPVELVEEESEGHLEMRIRLPQVSQGGRS